MERQIKTSCHFEQGKLKVKLPEDVLDIKVCIRTLGGVDTLKEDWDSWSLTFWPWGAKDHTSRALRVKLEKIRAKKNKLLEK